MMSLSKECEPEQRHGHRPIGGVWQQDDCVLHSAVDSNVEVRPSVRQAEGV